MTTATGFKTISVRDFDELWAHSELEVIDVRTPAEFRTGHVACARNVPLDSLEPAVVMAGRLGPVDAPLYVICQSGSRSARACEAFVQAGLPNVVHVEGGMQAWEAAGYPVVRPHKAISLERQARIAIGLMVVAAVLLTVFVHPYWVGLVGFLGAGLIFSGVVDFCGTSLILSWMPWNQDREQPETSCGSCKV
jgi:rhodanese-related sulfurtransferase